LSKSNPEPGWKFRAKKNRPKAVSNDHNSGNPAWIPDIPFRQALRILVFIKPGYHKGQANDKARTAIFGTGDLAHP
jgi:hypothetical protein